MTKVKTDDEKLSQLISEDGFFVVSKKSVRWAIGILSFVLMTLWGSLQYSVQQANDKTDTTNTTLTELVEALEKEEIDPIKDKVQKMEVTDAILLERTNSRSNNNVGAPPITVNPPLSTSSPGPN